MMKALKRLTALLFVFVLVCLSGCAGPVEKREIDYTFTKNNTASFIDDYLAEEYPAIGSLVEKVNAAQITESSENGRLVLDVFNISLHSRFYPLFNYSGTPQITSLLRYKGYAVKIDYIKVLDEETICLTTKMEDDDIEIPALSNMIFKRKTLEHEEEMVEHWSPTYQKNTENTEYEHIMLESYVTTVKLSKKDYKKIRVGDPAKKVYDIDSAVLWDLVTSRSYDYEDESIQVSFRVLSDGILAIRFKKTDVPVSDTGTVLDNLEVYKMDFIKFQNEMPEYYLGQIYFYKNEEEASLNELYVDFSINSADQVEFFGYK